MEKCRFREIFVGRTPQLVLAGPGAVMCRWCRVRWSNGLVKWRHVLVQFSKVRSGSGMVLSGAVKVKSRKVSAVFSKVK